MLLYFCLLVCISLFRFTLSPYVLSDSQVCRIKGLKQVKWPVSPVKSCCNAVLGVIRNNCRLDAFPQLQAKGVSSSVEGKETWVHSCILLAVRGPKIWCIYSMIIYGLVQQCINTKKNAIFFVLFHVRFSLTKPQVLSLLVLVDCFLFPVCLHHRGG